MSEQLDRIEAMLLNSNSRLAKLETILTRLVERLEAMNGGPQ